MTKCEKVMTLAELPAYIVQMRKKRGFSQARLAEAMGESAQKVARWEASEFRRLPLERLPEIAKALDVVLVVMIRPKKAR